MAKVAFITGGSSGLGLAFAKRLARQNWSVCLIARGAARLASASKEVVEATPGAQVLTIEADCTDEIAMKAAAAHCQRELGPIAMVVANAGYCVYGDFSELSSEDFSRQWRINVLGVIHTISPCLPDLRTTRGRIIITGSVSGHLGLPGRSAYAMSKFALRGLAESLAVELSPHRIHVTLVSPGFLATETRKVDRQGNYHPEFRETAPAWLLGNADTAAAIALLGARLGLQEVVITIHGILIVVLQRLLPGLITRILRFKRQLSGASSIS